MSIDLALQNRQIAYDMGCQAGHQVRHAEVTGFDTHYPDPPEQRLRETARESLAAGRQDRFGGDPAAVDSEAVTAWCDGYKHHRYDAPLPRPEPGTVRTPVVIPWENAEIHVGAVLEQAILYPLPVILSCEECGRAGYWYPEENSIHTASNKCPLATGHWRTGHSWALSSWNGNSPVPGVPG